MHARNVPVSVLNRMKLVVYRPTLLSLLRLMNSFISICNKKPMWYFFFRHVLALSTSLIFVNSFYQHFPAIMINNNSCLNYIDTTTTDKS